MILALRTCLDTKTKSVASTKSSVALIGNPLKKLDVSGKGSDCYKVFLCQVGWRRGACLPCALTSEVVSLLWVCMARFW